MDLWKKNRIRQSLDRMTPPGVIRSRVVRELRSELDSAHLESVIDRDEQEERDFQELLAAEEFWQDRIRTKWDDNWDEALAALNEDLDAPMGWWEKTLTEYEASEGPGVHYGSLRFQRDPHE